MRALVSVDIEIHQQAVPTRERPVIRVEVEPVSSDLGDAHDDVVVLDMNGARIRPRTSVPVTVGGNENPILAALRAPSADDSGRSTESDGKEQEADRAEPH